MGDVDAYNELERGCRSAEHKLAAKDWKVMTAVETRVDENFALIFYVEFRYSRAENSAIKLSQMSWANITTYIVCAWEHYTYG